MRLLVLATHAIQYYAPLYRELARRPGLDLTVAFQTDYGLRPSFDRQFGLQIQYDVPLTEGYRHVMLPEHLGCASVPGPLGRRNWSVRHEVAKADVLFISSFFSVTELVAAFSAWARGIPVIYRADSTLLTPRPPFRDRLRHLIMPALFRRLAVALYVGQQNRRYLEHFGVPPERLVFCPHSVDNETFTARAAALRPERESLRAAFGLAPGLPVILFAGKLIAKKQPLLLLEAFERLQATCPSQLLVVGDGDLRATFEAAVASRRVPRVIMAGFLNQSRMPEAYTAADLLVLPSSVEETWGLVVNEAMCFGLPAVVSDRVGCAADLVEDGVTGYQFRYDDVSALTGALSSALADESHRRAMGEAAETRIARYSVNASADAIERALRQGAGEAA